MSFHGLHRYACLVVYLSLCLPAAAQTIDPAYASNYTFTILGNVPGVPLNYGGLTLLPDDPNSLLIGGGANGTEGAVYLISVTRDAQNHINGFSGTASYFAGAEYNDGGVTYGPGGVLFLARWPVNQLGQVKPGSNVTDKVINLGPLGIGGSISAVNFVPSGFAGAGRMKVVTYGGGEFYDVTLSPDGTGTYNITSVSQRLNFASLPGGPEGFAYVPPGSPLFEQPAMILSEYAYNTIAVYDVDATGDPILGTRRAFLTELGGAEGAFIDPLTGDFLFSQFGGSGQVTVVRGFAATPKNITQWRSVRLVGASNLAIVLNPAASGNTVTMEPRSGGVQRIEIDFDGPVTAGFVSAVNVVGRTTTGCPACSMGPPVSYTPSSLTANGTNGIAINFAVGALPDQTCYTITLGPGSILQPIAGDNNCSVGALVGDVTGNGVVNLSDVILTLFERTQPYSPQYDVNWDGMVSLADGAAVKTLVASPARQALCP